MIINISISRHLIEYLDSAPIVFCVVFRKHINTYILIRAIIKYLIYVSSKKIEQQMQMNNFVQFKNTDINVISFF